MELEVQSQHTARLESSCRALERSLGQSGKRLQVSHSVLKTSVRSVVFHKCSVKTCKGARKSQDSEKIESRYVVGSEAKFNLCLVGMRSGYVHPCMKSSILCTGEVQQGVESMR